MGRQHQRMGRRGVRQDPEGSGEQRKIEESDCEVICGASTTLGIKDDEGLFTCAAESPVP